MRVHDAEWSAELAEVQESAWRSAPPAPEVGQIQMGATMDGVTVHNSARIRSVCSIETFKRLTYRWAMIMLKLELGK